MKLTLNRSKSKLGTTMGVLFVDGAFQCFTLEDEVRTDPDPSTPVNEAKVYGQTAIPARIYEITITMSAKFGKLMLLVNDVPGFTGIRIHSGNTAADTLGCILVGQVVTSNTEIVGGSIALPILFAKVKAALDKGEKVFLEINDAKEAA